MPPVLTVIRWRDIPAQVTAKDGRRTAKRVLHRRFQVAIDRAAMKAGKKGFSEYIGEWVSDRRACSDDLEAEVAATADKLEHDHTRHVLAELITNGGWRDPAAHPADPAVSAPGGVDPDGASTAEEATASAAEEPA
ncbi:MAG: virulence factor [Chloroflexota bacterium]